MARYGITARQVLGVSAPMLRALARELGTDHELAAQLWDEAILETRVLAALVDDPALVSEAQMEHWASAFDSWAVCDGCCLNLFVHTRFAWRKARAWSRREEEFVRRAGFALMACLAVHDKTAPDARFKALLPLIAAAAGDGRNFVKKAVNWALRQIGKRNAALNRAAVSSARAIARQPSASARWIAADAVRELTSAAVRARLARRGEASSTAGRVGSRDPARAKARA
jgi:3-methyladenine DNA glycosylase AlkD